MNAHEWLELLKLQFHPGFLLPWNQMSHCNLAMGCDHSVTWCSNTRALSVIYSHMGSPINLWNPQFHMDPLQLGLFYDVFSSAGLWKYLVTTKMSHYSARIALFYLFPFSCCHQGLWGFYSSRETLPLWDLQLSTPQRGTGQSQTPRRFHLELLKQEIQE